MIHLKNVHLASLFVAAGNRPPLVLNLQVSKRFLGHSLIFSNLPTFGVYCMLLLKTPSSGSKVWRKIKSLMIFLHLFSFVFSSMSQKNIIRKWKLLSWHHDSRMVSNLHRWELVLKLAISNHLPGDQALRFKKCPRIAATNAMFSIVKDWKQLADVCLEKILRYLPFFIVFTRPKRASQVLFTS